MPQVEVGGHLADYLLVVGPGVDGQPISFMEIAAWSSLTGAVLTSWEAETLRHLSVAYMGEYAAADDPKRPPPFAPYLPKTREQVAASLMAAFERLEAQDARRT